MCISKKNLHACNRMRCQDAAIGTVRLLIEINKFENVIVYRMSTC